MRTAEPSGWSAVVAGALAMGYAAAAVFFARFRRQSGAALFGWFALAFVLLAVQRVALVAFADDANARTWLYLLRLAAFAMILVGIWRHNRREPS